MLIFSSGEAKGWKSIHIISNDTLPVIFNISNDLQMGFTATHITVASKYYALEIPLENITEIKLNHDIIEDHSYIPEPEIPDIKEDPDEEENPDDKENPDEKEDPDNPDNPGEENEDPDIPTGITEAETEEVSFENDRIVFPLPTDLCIYSVDGICRDIRKGCEEIHVNSLPSGINILCFKGQTLRINK